MLQDQIDSHQVLKQRPRPVPQTVLSSTIKLFFKTTQLCSTTRTSLQQRTGSAKCQQAYTPIKTDATVQVCPALLSTIGTQLVRPLFSLSEIVSSGLHIQVEWQNRIMLDCCRHVSHDGRPGSRQLAKFAIQQAPQVQHVLLLTLRVVHCCLHTRIGKLAALAQDIP